MADIKGRHRGGLQIRTAADNRRHNLQRFTISKGSTIAAAEQEAGSDQQRPDGKQRKAPIKEPAELQPCRITGRKPGKLRHLREIDTAAAGNKTTAKEQPITKENTAVQPTPAHKQKKELREIDTEQKPQFDYVLLFVYVLFGRFTFDKIKEKRSGANVRSL